MAYSKVWVQAKEDRSNLRLEWLDPLTGKRRSQSAGTSDPKLAEEKRRTKEYELNHGLCEEPSTITWEHFRTLYTNEVLKGQRPRTREKADTVFDVFEQEIQPQQLAKINERTFSRFVQLLRERRPGGSKRLITEENREKLKVGLEPITIRNYLVCLRTAFQWADKQKLIPKCPDFPKIKVPKKKPQPILTETFERLMQFETDPHWRLFMCFGWWAGLRLSEVYELRWRESEEWPYVDEKAKRIVLPAKFVKSVADQWVPLHPELLAQLGQFDRATDRVFTFISARTKEPLTRSGVTSHVMMVAKRADVRLSMHKLRKGFGCRAASLLGKGRAAILHRLMRHSSMQITMDYYANVDDALTEALEELK